jgi:hypothetical protein
MMMMMMMMMMMILYMVEDEGQAQCIFIDKSEALQIYY